MNIKRAKQEIKDSIEAYLKKDAYGEYMIPSIRQRPVLLMGPPGIGKTQIMEQIAKECGIGLVAYTITHHTRQSAIGLPFIKEKVYNGITYSVTEYTMSEIIASVYEKIEYSGMKEGILFIDEINCVSETLAPTMLQFLQCKMFGNQQIPEGWMIVAAGNPPEYNKSVREFDVVTLDRIKKIEVEADFQVWKEYAYQAEIHPAILAYLEIKKDYFYKMETTVDGKLFVTARGWEDLSQLLKVYEVIGKKLDRQVVQQYVQHQKIAKDFANYYELYKKYKKDYRIEGILQGQVHKETIERVKFAPFDEKLSVVGLLLGKLSEEFQDCYRTDFYVTQLFQWLKHYKESQSMEQVLGDAKMSLEKKKKAGQMTKFQEYGFIDVIKTLEEYFQMILKENLSGETVFDRVRREFQKETGKREKGIEKASQMLEHAFSFMEQAFGKSQEMVVFVAELNANFYSVQFIKENGCDKYYQYNKGLLFDQRQGGIMAQLDAINKETSVHLER